MRLVTFRKTAEPTPSATIGALGDGFVIPLSQVAPDMFALIELGRAGLQQAERVFSQAALEERVPLAQVQLLAPIPRPRKNIVCLGMNYAEHARESLRAKGQPEVLPEHPVFFTKAVTSVNHPEAGVPLDTNLTQQLDWEVELAFIIGVGGKDIKREDAMHHVWGYTIINDVSARDLQFRHQQFFKGKSLDGLCPMGPCILTADEVPDPRELRLRLRVNGTTRQESSAADLIFGIPAIVEALSRGQTLEPGDIIATGTPSGVGMGLQPQQYLRAGDVMEAEIDRIGVLRNTVVEA